MPGLVPPLSGSEFANRVHDIDSIRFLTSSGVWNMNRDSRCHAVDTVASFAGRHRHRVEKSRSRVRTFPPRPSHNARNVVADSTFVRSKAFRVGDRVMPILGHAGVFPRAAPAGSDSRSAGRHAPSRKSTRNRCRSVSRFDGQDSSAAPLLSAGSSQPVSPTLRDRLTSDGRADCLSHSSTVCRRETAFQVDTVLDQPGNIRGDFPRTVAERSANTRCPQAAAPSTENQLSASRS